MDTISGKTMLNAMFFNGAVGVHHRYLDIEKLFGIMHHAHGAVAVSPSMGDEIIQRLFENGLIAVLDVAHGNTRRNLDFCGKMASKGVNIVSGNVATIDAAKNYLQIGVNYLRVGVGSGSVCSTRIVAGVGYPQGSAIAEINTLRKDYPNMRIISDGGHRTSGDIVKALALGADFVMLGGMLAGTDESEGYI